MRFGLSIPNFSEYSNPRMLVDIAREAEDAGWDGVFLWDHMLWLGSQPVGDTWTALTAIAMATERIKLGPMITPVPRYLPWRLAREAVTLDHLSAGRLVLGVGIGGDWFGDYSAFDQPTDDKTHAEMLDEGLAVITGLWSGEPFSFEGRYFRISNAQLLPRPLHQPRIPIWVAGMWPNKRPFRRAARWDGVVPEGRDEKVLTPGDYRELLAFITEHRTDDGPFDVTHLGETVGSDPAQATALTASYAEAGVTWWLEGIYGRRGPLEEMRERVRQGPPPLFR